MVFLDMMFSVILVTTRVTRRGSVRDILTTLRSVLLSDRDTRAPLTFILYFISSFSYTHTPSCMSALLYSQYRVLCEVYVLLKLTIWLMRIEFQYFLDAKLVIHHSASSTLIMYHHYTAFFIVYIGCYLR